MNNKSCIENNHKYDLWSIDKENNIAYRTCNKCKFKRILPITNEILDEIKKQDEASKIFKAFMLVDDYDTNLLNYIDLIVDDYLNYLTKEDFKALVSRIKKLEKLDIIDAKNILYYNQLDTYFVLDPTIEDDNSNLFIESEELNINSYEQS